MTPALKQALEALAEKRRIDLEAELLGAYFGLQALSAPQRRMFCLAALSVFCGDEYPEGIGEGGF